MAPDPSIWEHLQAGHVIDALDAWQSSPEPANALVEAACLTLVGEADRGWTRLRAACEAGNVPLSSVRGFAAALGNRPKHLAYLAAQPLPSNPSSQQLGVLAVQQLDSGSGAEAFQTAVSAIDAGRLSPGTIQKISQVLRSCPTPELLSLHQRIVRENPVLAAWRALAEVALFALDLDTAEHACEVILKEAGDCAPTLCIRGACLHLRGRSQEALEPLRASHALAPRESPAMVWLAEACVHLGMDEDASVWIRRANDAAHSLAISVVLAMLMGWEIARPEASYSPRGDPYEWFDENFPYLMGSHILPWASAEEMEQMPYDAQLAGRVARRILPNLGGNRTLKPTLLEQSDAGPILRAIDPKASARSAADDALKSLQYATPAEVRRQLQELQSRHPRSPHPSNFLGELMLWSGQLDQAEAEFEKALAIVVARWTNVGLGAVYTLRGQWDAAMSAFSRADSFGPVDGATTHVYRGEALRAQGHHDAAVASLMTAAESRPNRLGAWINLGLIPPGHLSEELRARSLREVMERRPALLWLTAQHTGLTLPASITDESAVPLLDACLQLMAGNRSSSIVSVVLDGELRVLPEAETILRTQQVVTTSKGALTKLLLGTDALPVTTRYGARISEVEYDDGQIILTLNAEDTAFFMHVHLPKNPRHRTEVETRNTFQLSDEMRRAATRMAHALGRSVTPEKLASIRSAMQGRLAD